MIHLTTILCRVRTEPEITTKELAAQLEMHGWSLWDSSWDGISIVGEFNGATDADSSRRGS